MESGFGSLDEVADVLAQFNPHRPRPTDLDGLTTNLRRRGDRWYWHWDPQFITGMETLGPGDRRPRPPLLAVEKFCATEVPMLLVRGQMSDLVSQERHRLLARFPGSNSTTFAAPGTWSPETATTSSPNAILDFLARHLRGS